jgi:ELWxxDGT repeat protein
MYFLPLQCLYLAMLRCIRFIYAKQATLLATVLILSCSSLMAQEFPVGLEYTPELVNVNGNVYFSGYIENNGKGIWKSNGTNQGTMQVSDSYQEARDLAKVGNNLFFQVNESLWKSDGTAAGTVMLKDFPDVSVFYHMTDVNGTLFFLIYRGSDSHELWKSDGTAAGTLMIKRFTRPGCNCPYPVSDINWLRLVNGNGTLYFTSYNETNTIGLWKSDGTTAGTVLVKNVETGGGELSLIYWNGNVYLNANNGVNGNELWKSNGTSAGTLLVKDINPGAESSTPGAFTVVNNTLFFTAASPALGRELWKTDGTAAGTVLVKDIASGSAGSVPSGLTAVNGTLFFAADQIGVQSQWDTPQRELWKSDGTAAGTVLVKDINTGSLGSNPMELTAVNGSLFFAATTADLNRELWKSNGTAAGTMLVKDILPGSPGSNPMELTAVNGLLLFTTNTRKLWKSDGTAAGTVELKVKIPAATCSATGSISREYWANVLGSTVATIPLNTTPTSTSQLTSLEAPSNAADDYGQRIRGFVCAPYTGAYTFYIASDDQSELWLGGNDQGQGKQKIASVTGYTSSRQWSKYPSQKSAPIYMTKGQKYYIEALHKEAAGGDNLAVGWTIPGTTTIEVISGAGFRLLSKINSQFLPLPRLLMEQTFLLLLVWLPS